ncbi:uncharacterized protein DUF2752 [Pedobacter cryoconitis]|uniref:Uncharacterized protein DUF2752 n=2 Tax=Pedobacter cryoconitis TaxID=188932 RepID=A0A327SZF6_9SPHI|nr:uncharacterized protein DUF2752 [Pedobacter cryoconitis]
MRPFMTLKFKTVMLNSLGRLPLELVFWVTGIVLLAIAEPQGHNQVHHFTFCPLANLGLDWCPGCGMGRSITQLFHGNLEESFHQHWLGIPAVVIIGLRIITLGQYEWKKIRIE